METERLNLLGLNREGMEAFFTELGEKAFRASQVLKWIHQHGVLDIDAMTNLSRSLRERLKERVEIRPPEIVSHLSSRDGSRKWLLDVGAGNCIEMVFIPEADRGTLCISSQVGCALDCSFCATAQQGLNRNLSSAEIIGQLWLATQLLQEPPQSARHTTRRVITNVVLMGMGEPLLNFQNVVMAMDLMVEDYAYGLARRRVTLSTAGIVPLLDRLKERCPVSLAVSLHAPDDELRNALVPVNRKYPIRDLLAACRRYVARDPKHKVTFEYVLLDGVNDGPKHAHELARLLRGLPAKINLIPFNPFPHTQYRCSRAEAIERFRNILLGERLMTITRKTRGDDIDAACGQLAGRVQPRTRRARAQTPTIATPSTHGHQSALGKAHHTAPYP